ncbi:ATP-binding cassette domain-containing protein [Dysgonomonas sp. 216]|uniref:ATP-binding cassette domain-containing protein n=1 Tax=Dysgonomonas sp. 216 TaxID=2302934 RepID=UPI0013D5F5F4|nr:ATP-binding cassette domain-containing protein [Dysgonomonas sp. 216]NDW19152.1 ATP-binding cassette domain-containing protein [Dysgonomonas sp. 216]
MDRILLRSVLPDVFADTDNLESGIWKQDINFDRGNSYLIEAASGKGKSSFCSFIYGYRKDFSGSIFFDKSNLNSISGKEWDLIRTNHLSLLFQDLALFPELTALENVLLKNTLTNHKTSKQITEMFGILGIKDKLNQKIVKMSWGQQQRVAIIRCLCQPFNFIILDEPISHLDDKNANIVAELVEQEAKLQEAAIIVTSIGKHLPLNYNKDYAL